MIRFSLVLKGTAPLVMHSVRLADPMHPITREIKKITRKTRKVDEDYDTLAELEFRGGLYIDEETGPYVPGENITRSLLDAARTSRQGLKVQRGLFISTTINPLAYDGPRNADGLWADHRFRLVRAVKVERARTMRVRPIFREWWTQCDGVLDPSQLDVSDLREIATYAGSHIGLCDWRPLYGRYVAEVREVSRA